MVEHSVVKKCKRERCAFLGAKELERRCVKAFVSFDRSNFDYYLRHELEELNLPARKGTHTTLDCRR